MQEHYLTKEGIYYRTNGFHPGRETIVFVHGLSGSSSAWAKFENYFDALGCYNIVSYDLRGHGKSAKPAAPADYETRNFAEDLHTLLEHLAIKRCILISHSLACFITLFFLEKYHAYVSRLVLLSPTVSLRDIAAAQIVRPFVSLGVTLLRWLPLPLKVRGHIDYSKYSDHGGDWNIPITSRNIYNTSLRVYLYATAALYYVDYTAFLPTIQVPTLVIHGRRDTIFPLRCGKNVAALIPNATFIVLTQANHILVLNHFREVSCFIERFIR